MNKKINNKGFTLVEILAVVVVLGILAAIVVPSVSRYINQGKEKYYRSLEDELVIIARDYYSKNKSELPRGQYDNNGVPMYINQVGLSTLINKGYVTNDIVDADKNPCTGYVRVENKSKGEYEYIACIKCSDKYTSEENNAYCTLYENFDESGNSNGAIYGALLCNINTGSYKSGEWTNKDVTATITSRYENGNSAQIGMYKNATSGTTIKAINNSATITLKESGNLKIYTYDRYGNRGECSLENIKIDKENPSVSFTSSNINTSNNGVKVTATLKDNNGVVAYQVNTSSDTPSTGWTTINEAKETTITTDYLTTSDSTIYYIWTKDVAGNVSKKRIIVGLSNWGNWSDNGHNSCSAGNLYEQRTMYNSRTKTTSYSEWSDYTETACTVGTLCESKSDKCIVTQQTALNADGTCPSGYIKYKSDVISPGQIRCRSNRYTNVYPSSAAAKSALNAVGVYDFYWDCYGPYTIYRTRTETTNYGDWTGYVTQTACDINDSNICLWRYECRTRTYTYTID